MSYLHVTELINNDVTVSKQLNIKVYVWQSLSVDQHLSPVFKYEFTPVCCRIQNFERLNGRVNITTKLSERLRLNSIFLYTKETRNALPENGIGSVLYNTINAFPTAHHTTLKSKRDFQ